MCSHKHWNSWKKLLQYDELRIENTASPIALIFKQAYAVC